MDASTKPAAAAASAAEQGSTVWGDADNGGVSGQAAARQPTHALPSSLHALSAGSVAAAHAHATLLDDVARLVPDLRECCSAAHSLAKSAKRIALSLSQPSQRAVSTSSPGVVEPAGAPIQEEHIQEQAAAHGLKAAAAAAREDDVACKVVDQWAVDAVKILHSLHPSCAAKALAAELCFKVGVYRQRPRL